MNLHSIASGVISAVNPMTLATIRSSTGATTTASGKRTPSYVDTANVKVQAQELRTTDLQKANNLNLTGTLKTFYANFILNAVDRDSGFGGDLILWGGDTWLVVHVIENFGDWCSVIGQKQVS